MITLPPELLGSLPRDVELTRAGRFVVALGALLGIAAIASLIGLSALSMSAQSKQAQREREGVTTLASVTRISVTRDDAGSRRTVTYVYEVDGRTFSRRQRLRATDRRPLREGDAIPIGYLPSQPESSWVQGYNGGGLPLFVAPMVAGALLFGALAIAWTVRRRITILSEGRVTLARVTASKKTGSHNQRVYQVSCEFETLSGARQSARFEIRNTPPPIGAIVPILYHRDRPQWTSPLPVPLVRTLRTTP